MLRIRNEVRRCNLQQLLSTCRQTGPDRSPLPHMNGPEIWVRAFLFLAFHARRKQQEIVWVGHVATERKTSRTFRGIWERPRRRRDMTIVVRGNSCGHLRVSLAAPGKCEEEYKTPSIRRWDCGVTRVVNQVIEMFI